MGMEITVHNTEEGAPAAGIDHVTPSPPPDQPNVVTKQEITLDTSSGELKKKSPP